MEENINLGPQNVIIEERKRLNITSVKDVTSFDDETILLDTTLGKMTIKGDGLRVTNFNNETGDFTAEGKIHAVVYMSQEGASGGFISRIFR